MNKKNIGAYINPKYCGSVAFVAGTTGDNTKVTGEIVDRLGYQSCSVNIAYIADLASSETLKCSLEVQESATGTQFGTATPLFTAVTIATGDAGGSEESGVYSYDIDLSGYQRYLKFNFTPNLSEADTATATVSTTAVLGGCDSLPI